MAGASGPLLALAVNDSWNVVNYRAGLIRALQGAGYRIAVIAPEGAHADAVRTLGVDFHPLAMQRRGKSPLADLALLANFRRLLRTIRPAAFLGFTAKPNIYGSLAARSCGVPVIINNISGLGAAFAGEGLLTRLVSFLYRRALRGSAAVFFQNRDDLQLFVSKRLVSAKQAALLPGSGVDLDRFAPVEPRGETGAATFLLVARLLWDKGIREYVEAARIVRRDNPAVLFQILGIIEPESAAAVPLSQLQQWQREGVVEYLGAASDVRPAMRAADCVVLPSYYREGIPRTLLEAASMAIPVITVDSPGCREAVDDRITGLICEPRSVDSLVDALRRMIRMSGAERAIMGASGRDKMAREFREELVHRAYIELLGKLGLAAS
jgi:glycosyltransferase involved in cell wall biosynthesis